MSEDATPDINEEVLKFVKHSCGTTRVYPETDIFEDLGCVGDDFHELMENYADVFEVNMKDYLWYFHANEEGQSIGALFFAPPYQRVQRIPVTPALLTEFARSGRWSIDYPEHVLPNRRADIIINQWLVGIIAFIAIITLIRGCL